jgi:transcription initiation factor TFIIIB Brf1 subunit/transcription initiation factor TFIIB
MIYYYLARAYNETQTPYNPHYLAKAVGIPVTKIQTAMCTFTKSSESTGTISAFKKPHDYVESQLIHSGLSSQHITDIIELINQLLEKDEDLLDTQPQVLSAAAILYFMELQQVEIPSNFRSSVNIPKSTLENMHKRICQIHNS